MTSENTSLNINRIPFLLKPEGKDYLWGGTRLNDDFSKNLGLNPLAESWECVTMPDCSNVIASGNYKGRLLRDVVLENPEMLGTNQRITDGIPVLIKFIDAKGNLSVQVHPDDEYARLHENGSLGKTEMWYVVEASKDAQLIYGFLHDMKKSVVEKSLKNNTIEKYLQKIPVKKGDVFFIPAGQVHAIGAGCLIAEVQESSNITYRLYDYNRTDKDGNKRPLHIEKALDVMNYGGSACPRQPMHTMRFRRGVMIESVSHCKYFQVEKVTLDTQRCRELTSFQTRNDTFRILLCIEGCGTISWDGGSLDFFRGDCIFVPADSIKYSAHGKAELLRVSC